MFSRKSNLFIVCIMLIVIGLVQQVTAVEMEAGTWTQKADMPTARDNAGFAVVDGKIYVIGGLSSRRERIAVVEEYDPATDTWMTRADMPNPRASHVAAAVDGVIYAIGGWGLGEPDLSTVEAYDLATDTWTTKADMPTARALSDIAVVDGQIYVIGGVAGETVQENRALSTVEAYDPATDTWTKKADMPTARLDLAACVVDGRIYATGGFPLWPEDAAEDALSTVEVYDPATDTWTQAPDMPRARFTHSASVVAGKLYIIGGVGDPAHARGRKGYSTVDVYDLATDTWTTAADYPTASCKFATGVVEGKIYIIGGWYGAGAILSTVEEFDPGLPGDISSVSPAGKLLETWGQIKKEVK